MAKQISATDVKVRFGRIVDWVNREDEEVIIQSRGQPKAVLISYRAYEDFLRLREAARRAQALRRLEALSATVRDRNRDLSDEEIETLADQIVREAIEEMIRRGEIALKSE